MAWLIEEKSGKTYELKKDQILIGRPTQDLSIQLDVPIEDSTNQVSRRHAIIYRKDDEFGIENLSRNRTLVNGGAKNFSKLNDGDRITIVNTFFIFQDHIISPAERRKRSSSSIDERVGKTVDEQLEKEARVRFSEDDKVPQKIIKEVDSTELHTDSRLFKETLLKDSGATDIERIQSLFRITNELSATLEEEELYKKAGELLPILLPMDRCAILIEDKEKSILQPKAIFPKDQIDSNKDLFVSRTVINQVLEKRVAFLASDTSMDEILSGEKSVYDKHIKSVMCVPLVLDGQVIGVCYVDSTTLQNYFGQNDLICLGIFSNIFTRAIINARTAREAERQAFITHNLERYFSPKLIGELTKEQSILGGKEVEVSVLFTDVRKFSDIAKRESPQKLVEILNEHFTLVADIILEYEGTIDKYMGDSVMAFWGAPVAVEHADVHCVRAAIEIQKKMKEWQAEKRSQGIESPLSIGIGINSGIAIAGNIGSPKRMDYSIVSDAVNMAERICSIAEPNQVLISRSTYEKVCELDWLACRSYLPRKVKGDYMLDTFEVIW